MKCQTLSVLILLVGIHCCLAQKFFQLRAFGDRTKCLAMEPLGSVEGDRMLLLPCDARRWYCQWGKSQSDAEYFNLILYGYKCLTVPGGNTRNGAGLIGWTCHDRINQQWKYLKSDDSSGAVYLKNKLNGKCASVLSKTGNLVAGPVVVQLDCANLFNQQFYVHPL